MDEKVSDEMAWIRGFTRGVLSDPPDDCPDPGCAGAPTTYTEGWKLGKKIGAHAKIPAEGGIVTVTSNPPGLEVLLDGRPIGQTPCSHGHGTGWHNIKVGDVEMPQAFCACPGEWTITTIADGDLEQLHYVAGQQP